MQNSLALKPARTETLHGLTGKRADLTAELERWQAVAADLLRKQRHINSALETLGIDSDGRKTIRETFRGENSGLVLAVLRDTKRALTCAEIAFKVLALRKLETESERLAWLMETRVREILGEQMKKGVVTRNEDVSLTRPLLAWRLA